MIRTLHISRRTHFGRNLILGLCIGPPRVLLPVTKKLLNRANRIGNNSEPVNFIIVAHVRFPCGPIG